MVQFQIRKINYNRINILRPDRGLQDRAPNVNLVAHPNSHTCLLTAPLAPVIHIDTKQVLGQKSLVSLYKIKTPYIIRQEHISSFKTISLSTVIIQLISKCTMKGNNPIFNKP